MISGPRADFEARCIERGYTLEEVAACIVSEDGDMITVEETHRSYPRARPVSLLTKAKNFATAAAKHVASGMKHCTEEQIAERHAICVSCEHYQDSTCMKCGCPIVREQNFISKLAWADQSCPVGKWGPVAKSD